MQCLDTVTNQTLALKKLHKGNRAERKEGLCQSAVRELAALQQLRHDNIIGVCWWVLRGLRHGRIICRVRMRVVACRSPLLDFL